MIKTRELNISASQAEFIVRELLLKANKNKYFKHQYERTEKYLEFLRSRTKQKDTSS